MQELTQKYLDRLRAAQARTPGPGGITMSYPRYSISRLSPGGYHICACGRMNCAVTPYAESADRAYRYDAPCTQEGHSRPVEVPVEEAEAHAWAVESGN
jgi:hypothetical protein